ncbi:hypothetical protein ACFQT4_08845 [Pseudoduganella danionis]|uniref:hypothetical protein n=1 Tax=Pseudoduganella danionis TaxID=1890295 RepID=UPI003622C85F
MSVLHAACRAMDVVQAVVVQKPVAQQRNSNQFGLVLPGLPASPKPGLNRAGLVDLVFFEQRHYGQRWFS